MNAPAQKITAQEISDDLSVFADIGTDPASVETTTNGDIVHLTRHGEPVDILISTTGALVERTLNLETRHANFKALLASDRYGNLRDWATKQKAYLDQELNTAGQGIDVKGLLNLGALLLASLEIADLIDAFEVSAVDLEECRFSGTAAKAVLDSVVISQLDCRGGDLTDVSIKNTVDVTLIADNETRVPENMPLPSKIQDITLGGRTIVRPEEREEWIANHLLNPVVADTGLVPPELRQHDMFKLLFKACRLRQYWMRRGDDMYAARILDNPLWPVIESALSNNNLLTVELREASGSDVRFIHVRRPEDIFSEKRDDPEVVGLFKALRRHLEGEVGLQ